MSVLALLTILIASIIFVTTLSVRGTLIDETKKRAEDLLGGQTWRLSADIKGARMLAEEESIAIESLKPATEDEVRALLKKTIETHPGIYGSAVAFEPGKFSEDRLLVAPYYHAGKNGPVYVDLGTPEYNYAKWEWFSIPRHTRKGMWGQPYFDEGGGNIAMVTYSQPFFKGDEFWGVATVDISLDFLTKEFGEQAIGQDEFIFLLDSSGKFLTKPKEDWQLNRTIFDIASEAGSEQSKGLGIKMLAGKSGFEEITDPLTGEDVWIAYGPVPNTSWSMGIIFPHKFVFEPVAPLYTRMTIIGIAGLIVIAIVLSFASGRITKPLTQFIASAKRIAGGDYSLPPLGTTRKDEIGDLARAFRDMESALADRKDE